MNTTTRKLRPEQVRHIREVYRKRERLWRELRMLPNPQQLADQLHMARATIISVAKGRHYKELP